MCRAGCVSFVIRQRGWIHNWERANGGCRRSRIGTPFVGFRCLLQYFRTEIWPLKKQPLTARGGSVACMSHWFKAWRLVKGAMRIGDTSNRVAARLRCNSVHES